MTTRARLLEIVLLVITSSSAAAVGEEKWIDLFNGKDLTGWKANADPGAFTEPEKPERPPGRAGRLLNPKGGAIALQAHDPKSSFYFREIRIRQLN